MMRMACRTGAVLALLTAWRAGAEEVNFRTDMEGELTFKNTGVSDISSAMLTETMGIVCYNDWQNPEEGQCNAVDFSNGALPEAGPHLALTDVKAQRFTVARFSDSMGVVCYTPFGTDHGRPACHTLSLSGTGPAATLSAGDGFEFDENSTYPYSLSVVGLTDTTGVLCYQDTTDDHGFGRHLTCMVLKVEDSTSLTSVAANDVDAEKTKPNPAQYDNITSTSIAKVSDTEVVVCYVDGTKNVAFCNQMSLTESGNELNVGPSFVLHEALLSGGGGASPGTLSVVALSESKGVACYCGAGGHGPTCAPLDFNGTEVSSAGDLLTVGDAACSEVSVAAVSETGAIACYMAGSGQVGTCSGLALNGRNLTTGDPNEIPAASGASSNDFVPPSACAKNECDQWISVSAQHSTNAVVCYAGVGGSATGRCTGLNIPPPTSTSTVTTTETSTMTETSSTTEHTTTETSTSTETLTTTTVTSTTETSSTTPHTTTATETSVTTVTDVPELSGTPAQAAGCAAAIAVASVLF